LANSETAQYLYLAICDSTGHGVPGAFMSLLNIGFLSEAINVKKIIEPAGVFDFVRQRLIESLSKDGQKDGFDGCLIAYDKYSRMLTYTAANNRPLIVRNNELIELSYDRMPVGPGEKKESFKNHHVQLQQGDMLYLFTDGYIDQFGGPKGKKFKLKQLQENLVKYASLETNQQKAHHAEIFESWKSWKDTSGIINEFEQLDDVCLFGIRIV
jgi:serine phosphatase RsbU (regulator of sigma subunit)